MKIENHKFLSWTITTTILWIDYELDEGTRAQPWQQLLDKLEPHSIQALKALKKLKVNPI